MSKITKEIDSFTKAILLVQSIIDLIIQNIPQAASATLPQGGVYIRLQISIYYCIIFLLVNFFQILSNPTGTIQSNFEKIIYIIFRMEQYCALTKYLMNKKNIVIRDKFFEIVLEQLEKAIIILYKTLLLYQMKNIYSYYQKQYVVFFRNLVNLDDQDSNLRNIIRAENDIQKLSRDYYEAYNINVLHQSVIFGDEMVDLFGNIY